MTAELERVHAQIGVLTGLLVRAARVDLEGSVLPGANLEGRVTGSSTATRTEMSAGVEADDGRSAMDRAPTHAAVVKSLSRTVEKLTALAREILPHGPQSCVTTAVDDGGGQFVSVSCQGTATRNGRCDWCAGFFSHNGFGPNADQIDHHNRTLPRWCDCGPLCCPDGCGRTVGDGDGRFASTCRGRMAAARKKAKALSSDAAA